MIISPIGCKFNCNLMRERKRVLCSDFTNLSRTMATNDQIKDYLRTNSITNYKTCFEKRVNWNFKGFYHLFQTMLLKTCNITVRSIQYTQL